MAAEHHGVAGPMPRFLLVPYLDAVTRHTGSLVLGLLNLDDFAAVNRLSFQLGDQLLTLVGERVCAAARLHAGTAYRLGRDEFAIVWPGHAADHISALAETILDVFAEPFVLTEGAFSTTLPITGCIGMTATAGRDVTASRLLGRANTAVQHAKRSRPHTALTWHPGMHTLTRRRDQVSVYGVIEWDCGYRPTVIVGDDDDDVRRQAVRILAHVQQGPGRLATDSADFDSAYPAPSPDASAASIAAWLDELWSATTSPWFTLLGSEDVHTRFTIPGDRAGADLVTAQPISIGRDFAANGDPV